MTPARITIHCTDNPNGSPIGGEDIRRYHTAPIPQGRGWPTIGYHRVIECDGGLYMGLPDDRIGIHVAGHNTGNLGVSLVGRTLFRPKQFETLRWLLDHWFAAYKIPQDELYCHYQWDTAQEQGKTCPTIPIEALRKWYFEKDEDAIRPYLLGA